MRGFLCCILWFCAASAANADSPVILVLGDSLSAAYGIPPETGWVALLAARLREQGYPYQVVNASISGETTSGGSRRLPALLSAYQPALVVLELGANDGLRGIALEEIRDNLQAMLQAAEHNGAQVLILRMEVPPNYGPEYTQGFAAIYDTLMTRMPRPAMAPFFLADVMLHPQLLQSDGLHPTSQAQPRLLEAVWPSLAPLLKRRETPQP